MLDRGHQGHREPRGRAMDMSLVERLLVWVSTLPQMPQLSVHCFRDYVQIALPVPDGAQYAFHVNVYQAPEDAEICALPFGQAPGCYFWYMPIEIHDYPSDSSLENEIRRVLCVLFDHATRTVQRKHLFSWSFDCCYVTREGVWHSVSATSCSRWGGFVVPQIPGRRKEYFSPPLI